MQITKVLSVPTDVKYAVYIFRDPIKSCCCENQATKLPKSRLIFNSLDKTCDLFLDRIFVICYDR